ncbi:MAG: hypothetical protein HQ503_07820 [Rhodospirillales bacterium]|nr:hypothetical protein [Rhodospirillales bacterium]
MRPKSAFPDRAERLDQLCSGQIISQNFALLKAMPVDADLFDNLQRAVNDYLYATLDAYYPDQIFNRSDQLVKTERQAIAGLPNITPNGLVLPKEPTYPAYNIVHGAVALIFEASGLAGQSKGVHAPVSIRLVNGMPNPGVDARPRASSKMHSDMWAGEPAGAIMAFLPVFGKRGQVGVKWIEPAHFPEEYMRPLDDFDEGLHLIENGREYVAEFEPGEILLSDPFLIHATQKNADCLRLSIDFRFLPIKQAVGDSMALGTRNHSYLSPAAWADIGTGHMLTTDAPLSDYTGPDITTSNDYAAPFEIKKIDG